MLEGMYRIIMCMYAHVHLSVAYNKNNKIAY